MDSILNQLVIKIKAIWCFEKNNLSFMLKIKRRGKGIMGTNKKDSNLNMSQIEDFVKKHHLQLFLAVYYALATIFALFWMTYWAILLAGVGAIIGFLFQVHVEKITHQVLQFTENQPRTTQYIFWGIRAVIAVFVPPIVFFIMGLTAGKSHAIDYKKAHHD